MPRLRRRALLPSSLKRAKPVAPTRPKGILRSILRAPVYLYRWNLGWLLGHRFLLLIHTGRRTGSPHQTVLEVMEYRKQGPEVVVMSGFGPNSDWLRNIEVTPVLEVIVGSQRFIANYRRLDEREAVEVVQNYEERNWFMAPIVRWVIGRLVGWKYRGSEADQQRLVRELPLIAFSPRS